jgi:hypothetical protein
LHGSDSGRLQIKSLSSTLAETIKEATREAAVAASTDALSGEAVKSVLVALKRHVNNSLDTAIAKADAAATWQERQSYSSTSASGASMQGSFSHSPEASDEHPAEPADVEEHSAGNDGAPLPPPAPDVHDLVRPKATGITCHSFLCDMVTAASLA